MTLSVGFLGYGFMGKAHANALARLPMFFPDAPATQRTVIVGRDESRLEAARDTLGFQRATTDWREAIDEVDVLYNLGPNHLHTDPTIDALDAGVHVLCEKPLATSAEESRRIAAAADRSDATAGVGFNYRFLPAIRDARNRIAAGDLGEIYHVRARYHQDWLADPETPWSWRLDAGHAGSGALGDLGSHAVDLLRYLCGDTAGEITEVVGTLRTMTDTRPDPSNPGQRRDVTVDDACTALLDFESGATGELSVTRCANGHKNDLTVSINGSTGSLRFSLERPNELEVCSAAASGYERIMITDDADPYIEHWWPPGHVLGWEHAFVHEHYEFLSAVESGTAFEPDIQTGHEVQAILDAIADSAHTNTTINPRRKQ